MKRLHQEQETACLLRLEHADHSCLMSAHRAPKEEALCLRQMK